MGIAAALGQALEGFGLLERGQVLALEVLHERDFKHFGFVDVANDHGKLMNAGLDGGMVAALAGDNLIPGAALANHQRLDNPLFGDRRDELGQVAHGLPGLVRVRVDEVDRHHPADRRRGRGRQCFDVMGVVPHPQRFGQSTLRHGP